MLEREFLQLGLNNNEREVYLAVLKAGKISPQRVARDTGINRTTVYSIARKLSKLGLLTEDLGATTAYLHAEKPLALIKMLEKEEKQLMERQALARSVATELEKLPSQTTYSVPRIRFVEEGDLNDFLYKQHDVWVASGERYDHTWWGYQDNFLTTSYGEWIDWCWQRPGAEKIKVRFFANEAEPELEMNKKHSNRTIRALKGNEQFDSSLWVLGDYVVMVYSRERPHYLVEIHDPVFARNHRRLFKNLWEENV